MTPSLTLTTAMQMLPLSAAMSFEPRGPQCLLALRGEYAERRKKYDIIFRFSLRMEKIISY